MSRKPESVFITSVHKHLPAGLYRIKNNNPFSGGVPDCWYSGPRADLWVEYKFIERIPQAGVLPNLSELQLLWLRERYREGRNVAVVVGTKNGGIIFRKLAWESTMSAIQFNQSMCSRQHIADWIQSETGERNDKERSRDLPSLRDTPAQGRRKAPDMRRPI